jgi:hypothetical protein
MKIIEVQVPEPVYRQIEEVAAREEMTVEQLCAMAIAQAAAAWSPPPHPTENTKKEEQVRFLNALNGLLESES